jgi:hypothetical protein
MNNIDLTQWLILNEPGEPMLAIHLANIKYIEWCNESLNTRIYFIDGPQGSMSIDCRSKNAKKLALIFGIDNFILKVEESLGRSIDDIQAEIDKIGF